jgi:hypothetical protein
MPPEPSYLLYWLIVGCEAAFWLVLLAGLAARYLLRRERLSRALLLSLPVVDILLVAFTAADLKAGTTATVAHGLATAYVGFTVAFGAVMVRWADQRFAHRFAGGPAPVKTPDRGWPAVRHELELWLRCVVAWIIALAVLIALIAYVDNDAITQPLHQWFRIALGSVFLWFVFGPVWSVVFFRREAK